MPCARSGTLKTKKAGGWRRLGLVVVTRTWDEGNRMVQEVGGGRSEAGSAGYRRSKRTTPAANFSSTTLPCAPRLPCCTERETRDGEVLGAQCRLALGLDTVATRFAHLWGRRFLSSSLTMQCNGRYELEMFWRSSFLTSTESKALPSRPRP